jgi:TolA-binding protein
VASANELLPVLLLGRVAAEEAGASAGRWIARAAIPGGGFYRAEAAAETLDRYLAKQISAQEFAGAVRLESPPAPTPAPTPAPAPKKESEILLGQCDSLFQSGDYAGAERVARDLVARFPQQPGARYWLARSLAVQTKFKEAFPVALRAVEDAPRDPETLYVAAFVHSGLEKHREAVGLFERSRREFEATGTKLSEIFYVNLSYCYAQIGDSEMCAHVAGEGLKFYPESKDLQTNYKAGYKAQLKKR